MRTALKDVRGEIADYTETVQRDPQRAEAYMNRGLLYEALQKRQAALADLQQAAVLFNQLGARKRYQQIQNLMQQLPGRL